MPALNRHRIAASLAATLVAAGAPLATIAPLAVQAAQADEEAGWKAMAQEGSIVLLRHADAPGVGDPPGFRLGDCSTQRNLGEAGRVQARRLGDSFRSHGVKVGAVLTSQWCRTRETAELAFHGRAVDDPSFNSFFDNGSAEAPQTAAALSTLNRWRGPGVLVVTTHQVNITALTGIVPASGEGVVVRPKERGIEVVARVKP